MALSTVIRDVQLLDEGPPNKFASRYSEQSLRLISPGDVLHVLCFSSLEDPKSPITWFNLIEIDC